MESATQSATDHEPNEAPRKRATAPENTLWSTGLKKTQAVITRFSLVASGGITSGPCSCTVMEYYGHSWCTPSILLADEVPLASGYTVDSPNRPRRQYLKRIMACDRGVADGLISITSAGHPAGTAGAPWTRHAAAILRAMRRFAPACGRLTHAAKDDPAPPL